MLKLFAIILLGAGIYIGVIYGDEIRDAVDNAPVEELRDAAESAVDFVKDNAES